MKSNIEITQSLYSRRIFLYLKPIFESLFMAIQVFQSEMGAVFFFQEIGPFSENRFQTYGRGFSTICS